MAREYWPMTHRMARRPRRCPTRNAFRRSAPRAYDPLQIPPPAAAPDPRVPGLALLQCSSWRHLGQHDKYAGTGCYDRGGRHLTGVARVNVQLQKWSETDAVPCSHSSSTLQYSSGRLLLSCTRSAALDCSEYGRRRAGLPRPGRHSPDLPPPAACHHGPLRLRQRQLDTRRNPSTTPSQGRLTHLSRRGCFVRHPPRVYQS